LWRTRHSGEQNGGDAGGGHPGLPQPGRPRACCSGSHRRRRSERWRAVSEQTLAIIKPDAVNRGLTGKILARLEEHGFTMHGLKLVHLSKGAAQAFYRVHAQRPFYDSLTSYMSSGPIVPILLERDNAIQALRELMGATDPQQAAPGTIR